MSTSRTLGQESVCSRSCRLRAAPELGIGEMARTLPQLILYLQFPFDGLITSLNLKRGTRLSTALVQVFFLHGVGAFVLWLLSQTPATPQ